MAHYRHIAVVVDAADATGSGLPIAAMLARQAVRADPRPAPLVTGVYMTASVAREVGLLLGSDVPYLGEEPSLDTSVPSDDNKDRFLATMRGLPTNWVTVDRGSVAGLAEIARLADVTIIGQQNARGVFAAQSLDPAEVAIAAGAPVLIVPFAGSFAEIGKRVLVCWDGSREASRAMRDAVPLLAASEMVTVVRVGASMPETGSDEQFLHRALGYLTRHGIRASSHPEPGASGVSVAELLLSRAADLGADLIVAGCYGHSPLQEAFMGGVTRELFRSMTVPVLTSH